MARSRNIKPGFYKNEELAECSVWARFIFPGLWMLADRAGRLEDRPKRIKGELIPFDSQDVESLLRELEGHGFLERYEIDGQRFIQISKFLKHQSPHYSEKESIIKPPPILEHSEKLTTIKPPLLPEHSEKSPSIKRGSQPPDSLIPDSLIPDCPNPSSSNPDSGKKKKTTSPSAPPDVDPKVWADWLQVRKGKRAAVTNTALDGWRREAQKANLSLEAALRIACERGWQSFKAEWLVDGRKSDKPAIEQRNREHGKEWLRRHESEPEPEVFDAPTRKRSS